MTLRLDLKPEVEAALISQANARGVSLDTYVQDVLEDAAHAPAAPKQNADRLHAALDRLAETGRGLPHIPSSALSREGMYRDHD